jgi:hypothetical protein
MKKTSALFFAMMIVAAAAFAQHGGPGPEHGGPGGPGDFGHGPGGGAIVGSDGTIFIVSESVDTSNHTVTQTIKAVTPTGTVAWTVTPSAAGHIILSDGNLIVESASRASDGTVTTTLTAISTASGATAWTKTITGHVELHPFSGGTYAIVTVPATSSGGSATRSLIGISNSGSTLFTLAL